MQSTVARDLGISVETVKRAVKKLKQFDLIEIRRVKGPRGHPVNHYSLIMPWQSKVSPMTPD